MIWSPYNFRSTKARKVIQKKLSNLQLWKMFHNYAQLSITPALSVARRTEFFSLLFSLLTIAGKAKTNIYRQWYFCLLIKCNHFIKLYLWIYNALFTWKRPSAWKAHSLRTVFIFFMGFPFKLCNMINYTRWFVCLF